MKINIVKPTFPEIDSVSESFSEILNNGLVTNNSIYVRSFESSLMNYLDAQYTPISFCNGEMALFNLIQSWKIKLGYTQSESFKVLVPSFTFSGTVNAIVLNGLEPVFCDVDDTLTIDIEKCSSIAKSDDVKMIVAVGVYGNLPDVDKLANFAEDSNCILLFDNAPAFGSTYRGKFVNNYGFDEIFSFHATKIMSSMEGGVAIVNSRNTYELLSQIRDFGQVDKNRGDISYPGLNSKMQEISAIVGLENLKVFNKILDNRLEIAKLYEDNFRKYSSIDYIKCMKVNQDVKCCYLYFPIILNKKADSFVAHMSNNNITVRRYYTAVHDLSFYRNKYSEIDLSFTNSIKDRIVALPLHSIMSDDERGYLFKIVDNYLR